MQLSFDGADRLVELVEARRGPAPARGAARSIISLPDDSTAISPTAITALTGIAQGYVRGAPSSDLAVRRFLSFAGDAVLVAHNARFDMGFLDRAVERLTGRRVATPVVDTVWLARRLLSGRTKRF